MRTVMTQFFSFSILGVKHCPYNDASKLFIFEFKCIGFSHGDFFFWMTVGFNPHLHTNDRVRRTLCRQHVLRSAVTMTITVLKNYKLGGGTSAVQLSSVFLRYLGGRASIKHSLRTY